MLTTTDMAHAVTLQTRLAALKALTQHAHIDRYFADVMAARLDEILYELLEPTAATYLAAWPTITVLHAHQDENAPSVPPARNRK